MVIQWVPLAWTTLGQRETDSNNRLILKANELNIYLVLISNMVFVKSVKFDPIK